MISLAWPGRVFFISSYRAIRSWTANLDLPITLALFVGAIAGTWNTITARGDFYFDSLSMLVFLLLVGRFIQYKQQRRAESSLEMLFALTPQTARRVEGVGSSENVSEVPTQAIALGDVIEVRSGELLPADGVVESGYSAINNALLTGESRPIDIAIGSTVSAGSLNVGGVVRLRVTACGETTRLGRLMKLVESGLGEKPQLIRFTDRIGRWFLPVVLVLGVVTFAYWWSINREQAIDNTVAILIVTCPCVLGLAVPLTMGVTIGRLARQGTLVKSAAAVERLASQKGGRVVLDKTGTITHGRLSLTRFAGDASIKPIVGRIESGSNHPVARALVAEFGSAALMAEEIVEGSGGIAARCDGSDWLVGSTEFVVLRGATMSEELARELDEIREVGASAVVMARDGRVLAVAGLEDAPRADSAEAIAAMREMGWEVEILSGDHRSAVDRIARQVGIDANHVHADVVAEQKLEHVRRDEDAKARRLTIMIGDGVNDSAALAAADVGIAVAGGAETSLAAADVYASSPGLMPTVRLMRACRRTMRILKINFGISLAYNVLAGALAILGLMHPLAAAIIMPLSSVTVLSIGTAMVMRGIRPTAGDSSRPVKPSNGIAWTSLLGSM
jgi:Cu2+-exporting ATPase